MKKCFKCKDDFQDKELVSYTSPGAKIAHNYCPKCLQEKQDMDFFKLKAYTIFGENAIWPLIMKRRKKIQDTYGYTDRVIADCLDYLYNVEKIKTLTASLGLVTPRNVDKMKRYKRAQTAQAGQLTAAAAIEIKEYSAPIQENKSKPKEEWNFEDWL